MNTISNDVRQLSNEALFTRAISAAMETSLFKALQQENRTVTKRKLNIEKSESSTYL
jgi:hypothetical protein